jgi:hypothetical protein
VADEVPPKGVRVPVLLGDEVLQPVLADHLDARRGQDGHVFHRHVLGRDDDRDPVADLRSERLVAFPDRIRT